jgi:hypothetical protein
VHPQFPPVGVGELAERVPVPALLMYDAETVPVASAPAGEHLTVHDGRITHLRIVFDRAPFDAARRARTV